jgi:leucyl-tRNA synthetase
MSKRWGNIVNPDDMVERFGADAVRMYLAFIGPYNEPGSYPWNLTGVEAMRRFLDRVYALRKRVVDGDATPALTLAVGAASAKVAADCERFKFNTAISALMICLKELESATSLPRAHYTDFLTLLAPFAPHLTDHLFRHESKVGSVHDAMWPEILQPIRETLTVIVQVNGKKRGVINLTPGATEEEARAAAESIPSVQVLLREGEVQKIVYVPGRILNVVISGP